MKVYVMLESSVFHTDPDCPALNRSNRYRTPASAERLTDGTIYYMGGFRAGNRVRTHRRACQVCANAASSGKDRP